MASLETLTMPAEHLREAIASGSACQMQTLGGEKTCGVIITIFSLKSKIQWHWAQTL